MTEASYKIISFKGSEIPSSYEGFIFSSWLRSLRKGNEMFAATDSGQYYREYHAFIGNLLKKPDSVVRMAVLVDDPDVVLGFSASREDVLDYVYVHFHQRGLKISDMLIPSNITTFTHMTKMWLPIWQSKYKHWKFNPFA